MIRSIFTVALLACCFSAEVASTPKNHLVLDPTNEKDKKQLVIAVAALMGREFDPNDPKALQAAEAFLVADTAKAYAFTRIHAIPLEFCPENTQLANALSEYEDSAEKIIALGKLYYANGIHFTFGEKRISQSGQELQDGLDGMLEGIRKEYEDADAQAVAAKCKETVEALRALRHLYGG